MHGAEERTKTREGCQMGELWELKGGRFKSKAEHGQDVGVLWQREWQRWKPRGRFLDYSEVIVSCSQHGDQSGHDSEKDAKLEIIFCALKPWRVKEARGAPRGC